MRQHVDVIFHNLGLRSWIECSMCASCPDSKGKGCCCYKPLYMPADLAYLQQNQPEVLERVLAVRPLTMMETCFLVENYQGEDGTLFCRFHSRKGGCTLEVAEREYVCRRYVCEGVPIWDIPGTGEWQRFFGELERREAELNGILEKELKEAGASLNRDVKHYLQVLQQAYDKIEDQGKTWFENMPVEGRFTLEVDDAEWHEWAK